MSSRAARAAPHSGVSVGCLLCRGFVPARSGAGRDGGEGLCPEHPPHTRAWRCVQRGACSLAHGLLEGRGSPRGAASRGGLMGDTAVPGAGCSPERGRGGVCTAVTCGVVPSPAPVPQFPRRGGGEGRTGTEPCPPCSQGSWCFRGPFSPRGTGVLLSSRPPVPSP